MLATLGRGLSPGVNAALQALDPDATAYFDAVATAGGSLSAIERLAADSFIKGAKAAGLWSKLHDVSPFLGDDLTAALVKLKAHASATTSLTNVNFVSGDYDRAVGLTGDGATKYADTNLPGVSVDLDSVSYGAFVTAAGTAAALMTEVRTWSNAIVERAYLYSREATGKLKTEVWAYGAAAGAVEAAVATPVGFSVGQWDGTNRKIFKDGVKLAETSGATGAASASEFAYLGGASYFSDRTIGFGFIGEAMSEAEQADLHGLVQSFMTLLGRSA